jgi:hypothetical protein
MARDRDAADVAISTAFGPAPLARFTVVTDEVTDENAAGLRSICPGDTSTIFN